MSRVYVAPGAIGGTGQTNWLLYVPGTKLRSVLTSVGRGRQLDVVGVAMVIDANDGVDEFCQHGHWSVILSRGTVNVDTGLGTGHRSGISVMSHALGRTCF
ncbi:MAG: hypothetical protein ACRDRG_15905 [Pseudonocardiaceae bacterium]